MATKKKRASTKGGGRGSPEAIEKRRLARQLNTMLAGGGAPEAKLDGRTEKRRQRLIADLKGSKELKPIDVVSRVNELLDIGETPATLKKQGVKPRKMEVDDATLEIVKQTQAVYGFDARAWRFLGIRLDDTTPESERAPKRRRAAKGAKKKTTRKRRSAKA